MSALGKNVGKKYVGNYHIRNDTHVTTYLPKNYKIGLKLFGDKRKFLKNFEELPCI